MFSANKDTLIMFALAVSLFATFYIYKEMQKTKLDVQKLNDTPEPLPQPVLAPIKTILKKKTTPEPEIVADEST